jgi:hypothetical protein
MFEIAALVYSNLSENDKIRLHNEYEKATDKFTIKPISTICDDRFNNIITLMFTNLMIGKKFITTSIDSKLCHMSLNTIKRYYNRTSYDSFKKKTEYLSQSNFIKILWKLLINNDFKYYNLCEKEFICSLKDLFKHDKTYIFHYGIINVIGSLPTYEPIEISDKHILIPILNYLKNFTIHTSLINSMIHTFNLNLYEQTFNTILNNNFSHNENRYILSFVANVIICVTINLLNNQLNRISKQVMNETIFYLENLING